MKLKGLWIGVVCAMLGLGQALMGAEPAPGGNGGGRGGAPGGRGGRGGPAGGGRGGFMPGGMGGPGGMLSRMQRDVLQEALVSLGELNLQSDFTLSAEQKAKVQAIREEAKTTQEKWRKDSEAEMTKLREEFRSAFSGGRPEQEKLKALNEKRQKLQESAPKMEQYVDRLKEALTAEQAKAFDAKVAEKKVQAEEARKQMEERMNRFRQGGRGGNGAKDDAKDGGGNAPPNL